MQAKAYDEKKGNDAHPGLDEWVEKGNRLHDRAVFDFIVRLLPMGIRSLKRGFRGHHEEQFGLVS